MVEILKLMLDQISSSESRPRFVFELVIRTQPSGPLCLWQCLNINFRLTVRGINFSPIFSPHLVTNPSSQTLKYKFRAKTILDVAICVIFCSILCFIFSVLRLYQLFLLLSREKKFHQITSLSDSFLSKYFPV